MLVQFATALFGPFTDVSRKVTLLERRFAERRCHEMSRRRRHDRTVRHHAHSRSLDQLAAAVAVDVAPGVVA